MNSLKHGMTGAGVVLAEEDAREVAAQVDRMGAVAEVRPMLARRVAVLAQRLDRLAQHEEAVTARRLREAEPTESATRGRAVDALIARLAADPVASTRELRTTPEGCDRLLELWTDLVRCRELGIPWKMNHVERAESLSGHDPMGFAPSDWRMLTHVSWGRTRLTNNALPQSDYRDPSAIQAEQDAARVEIDDRLATVIQELRELRDRLSGELDAEARRAEAEALTLFDTSPQAALLRRYEMATERGLYRALRELEQPVAEGESIVEPEPEIVVETAVASESADPLGSFGAEASESEVARLPQARFAVNPETGDDSAKIETAVAGSDTMVPVRSGRAAG